MKKARKQSDKQAIKIDQALTKDQWPIAPVQDWNKPQLGLQLMNTMGPSSWHQEVVQPPPSCKLDQYSFTQILGQGAFGKVFKAQRKETGELVAVKQILEDENMMNRETQILSMIRGWPSLINLQEYFYTSQQASIQNEQTVFTQTTTANSTRKQGRYLNLVCDFMPTSMSRFNVNSRQKLASLSGESQAAAQAKRHSIIKQLAYQFFEGLAVLHSRGIAHRDIKPDNILVDAEGVLNHQKKPTLKICDFGSAKQLKPHNTVLRQSLQTNPGGDLPTGSVTYISTRYYRAPELLYGNAYYGVEIDLWAAGCVIAELFTKGNHKSLIKRAHEAAQAAKSGLPLQQLNQGAGPRAGQEGVKGLKQPEQQPTQKPISSSSYSLFQGSGNVEQLALILMAKGSPSGEDMKSVNPCLEKQAICDCSIDDFFSTVLVDDTPDEAKNLISKLLEYDPHKRMTAQEALCHPFFADLRPPVVAEERVDPDDGVVVGAKRKRPQTQTAQNQKKPPTGKAVAKKQPVEKKGKKRVPQQMKTASSSTQKSTTPEEGELSKTTLEQMGASQLVPNKRRKKSHNSKQSLDVIPAAGDSQSSRKTTTGPTDTSQKSKSESTSFGFVNKASQ